MFRFSTRGVLVLTAMLLCGALFWTAGASGDGLSYPAFATPDGLAASEGTPGAVAVPALPNLLSYSVPETASVTNADPPSGNLSHILWGYEAAAAGARILQYTIIPGVVAGPTCVPSGSLNGRGLAFNPRDGNLWYTYVTFPGFNGDGFIHETTPPPACAAVTSIPFGDGPGGTIQDDIGALDVDEGSGHLWAAGYKPVVVMGVMRSYLYLVNRNNGHIIQSCWLPFRGGGVGNDTLAAFKDPSLPGSSKYLLTDAGEDVTTPNSLALIDQSDCHGGNQVTPIMEFPKTQGMTGIDFEWPGLLNANLATLFNNGNQPFSTSTLLGAFGNTTSMEDITLCGYRAVFGGDGNDACPY